MYERLADRSNKPTVEQIKEYLDNESYERLLSLEEYLRAHYQLSKQLRFPFGSNYGWGYKYSHKSAHLCYIFFEKGAFTVTLQIGDRQVHLVEKMMKHLSQKAQELWTNRYPCGEDGGWIHYRVLDDNDLNDIYMLVGAKRKPVQAV